MNLKLGEIKVNEVLLKRDTTMEEINNNPIFQSYDSNDDETALFTIEQATVDGYTFFVDIYFVDKQLDNIRMEPLNLEMKDPGYPDEKYQNEKKKVCDEFLRKHLGNPLKESKAVLCYSFDWGSAYSVTYLRGQDAYMGGFIEINYK